MPKIGTILAGACLAAGLAGLASAAEYCVTCEGPPGLYRCVIDGTPEGPGKDQGASLHCISQLAKQGKHERCAVSRGALPRRHIGSLAQQVLDAVPCDLLIVAPGTGV